MSAVLNLKSEKPLFLHSDWNFDDMKLVYEAIEEIALNDLGLDVYPNQIEIISSEQMLDAYSCIGLPLMYQHWSFGKRFLRDESMYRKGLTGLAYEIVINSNPCISYNMEGNSMAMQTLVMAHAAFGHNHFFKNNHLFKYWTDAEGIHDYLAFAKSFVAKCEERYGFEQVEDVLDAAHAIMDHGVFRYRHPASPTARESEVIKRQRDEFESGKTILELWADASNGTVGVTPNPVEIAAEERLTEMNLPQENILYFLEKHSPVLQTWQRELLRIVRFLAQYFYPQKQTKVMNEGCACFVHYHIMNKLHDHGLISPASYMEILHSHTNVIQQRGFDDPHFGGLNPYALGFAMMQDIKRICTEPTAEDCEWFPDFAGNGDWRKTLLHAWANYRDESFILQFLSPKLIRDFGLFVITDDEKKSELEVTFIHDQRGYRRIRENLAKSYDLANLEPDIQVVDADLAGDRELKLRHVIQRGILLESEECKEVLKHIKYLWGYEVCLSGVKQNSGETVYKTSTKVS